MDEVIATVVGRWRKITPETTNIFPALWFYPCLNGGNVRGGTIGGLDGAWPHPLPPPDGVLYLPLRELAPFQVMKQTEEEITDLATMQMTLAVLCDQNDKLRGVVEHVVRERDALRAQVTRMGGNR